MESSWESSRNAQLGDFIRDNFSYSQKESYYKFLFPLVNRIPRSSEISTLFRHADFPDISILSNDRFDIAKQTCKFPGKFDGIKSSNERRDNFNFHGRNLRILKVSHASQRKYNFRQVLPSKDRHFSPGWFRVLDVAPFEEYTEPSTSRCRIHQALSVIA